MNKQYFFNFSDARKRDIYMLCDEQFNGCFQNYYDMLNLYSMRYNIPKPQIESEIHYYIENFGKIVPDIEKGLVLKLKHI
jgi:hypothetical protein